ncbi:Zinc finger protein, partial [Pseudolycoriella hygida]
MRPLYGSCLDKMLMTVAEVQINFANDDVIKLEALVDVENLESEIITEAYDTYSNDDSASNTQNIILTADDAVTELLFQTEEETDENEFTEAILPEEHEQHSENHSLNLQDEMHETPPVSEEMKDLKFACEVCHKRFAENKILKRHLKIHSPIKPHVCSVCNMSFAESSNLTKHKKKHTGELRNVIGKPNLCSVCGKGFKWASSLSKHMKHHTKHKVLNCPYCPKYYVEARLRHNPFKNTHWRTTISLHSNMCDKTFARKETAVIHQRTHTGLKPHICKICNRGFASSGHLTGHMRSHSGVKNHECTICKKRYAGGNTLKAHMKSHETKAQLTITEILMPENMVLDDNAHSAIKSDISISQ